MKNSFYVAADLDACRSRGHRFRVVWSDKTPLKASMLCDDCTDANPGKTAYVAYGDPLKSWGQWRRRREREQEEFNPSSGSGE